MVFIFYQGEQLINVSIGYIVREMAQEVTDSQKLGVYLETIGRYSLEMHDKLTSWANSKCEELLKKSKRQRDKFTTASVVYYYTTGNYYGRNKGIKLFTILQGGLKE